MDLNAWGAVIQASVRVFTGASGKYERSLSNDLGEEGMADQENGKTIKFFLT